MNINQFDGFRIVVSPLIEPVAKVRLRDNCPCTDDFRTQFNRWLKEFFGTKENMVVIGKHTVVVSPAVHKRLMKQLWGDVPG